jgi:myosin-3
VAVLDIFGFENFKSNGFEQMFINTANEKLQHYFIDHIFTYEVRELKEEGIRAPVVEYTTNENQVELMMGNHGIFGLLDEQTKVPRATDESTIIKMHAELASNASYDNMRKSPVEFKIAHYAGDVVYQIEGYLEKNQNAPSLGIASMLKSSAKQMIADLFKSSETTEERLTKDKAVAQAIKTNDQTFMRRDTQKHRFGKKEEVKSAASKKPAKKLAPWQIKNMEAAGKTPEKKAAPKLKRENSAKRRAGLTTLSAAFKGSLEDLMEILNAATPHFVRCIKPNMTKSAKVFDAPMVQKQLNYTGVLETTKIRQNGYPLRLTYAEFVDRHGARFRQKFTLEDGLQRTCV